MPQANTLETYDNSTMIKDDLSEAYSIITPEEVPFQNAIGVGGSADSTYVEWAVVDLQEPDAPNREVEGVETVPNDDPTLGLRMGNYTQISDKVVAVSHTSEAVDAYAENIQRLTRQMALKLREMKRDMEVMLLSNLPADAGGSGTPRVAAGFATWLRTNVILGAGGAAPTLSGTDRGYPDSGVDPGTAHDFLEEDLNDIIQQSWESGAEPTILMVNGNNKRILSQTFTGNSTRYKDAIDRRLISAVDVYTSDFGEVTVVPNRFLPTIDDTYSIYAIDPNFAEVVFLEGPRNKPLAETGHAHRRMIWAEYTLKVHNEAAHGAIHGTNGVMPTP